ncbi:hypothetical protein [Vibrio sp. CUB2]|uniref:hypothetical protein n=1 Tax=Vibrio sp. CUB2 TaxID=2315233 RepID=UPI000769E7C0|nr:hypothetical protein [Vibrio sp. CUB2]
MERTNRWAMNFVSDFFDKEMKEGENLVIVVDNEKLPKVEYSSLQEAFCKMKNIRCWYGKGIKLDSKTVYFVTTKMQTIAGYSGHCIVMTSGKPSRTANILSTSISLHKRWSWCVVDLSI